MFNDGEITADAIYQIPELYNKFYNFFMIRSIGLLLLFLILIGVCIMFIYKTCSKKKEKRRYSFDEFSDLPWYKQSLFVIIIPTLFISLYNLVLTIYNIIELIIIPEITVASYIFNYFNK